MTPEQVVQSLELQSTFLRDRMATLPKGSQERQAGEQTLLQYDEQLERVRQEYKKQGFEL
jgi:exonuclease VII small subunit